MIQNTGQHSDVGVGRPKWSDSRLSQQPIDTLLALETFSDSMLSILLDSVYSLAPCPEIRSLICFRRMPSQIGSL